MWESARGMSDHEPQTLNLTPYTFHTLHPTLSTLRVVGAGALLEEVMWESARGHAPSLGRSYSPRHSPTVGP